MQGWDPKSLALRDRLDRELEQVSPPDDDAGARCKARWNTLCKPIHGLGLLEDLVCQIGAVQGTDDPRIDRAAIVIMGADNGVTAEGVSQCGSEVTAQVLRNMGDRTSSVCMMAKARPAEVFPVDIGLLEPADHPGVLDRAVRRGCGNIRRGPAMSRAEALEAILTGMDLAAGRKAEGCQILIPGEMGIGNTTTTAACICALFGRDPVQIAGPGAGLTSEGVAHKAKVIRDALAVNGYAGRALAAENRTGGREVLTLLADLGGLDIAGMTGLFLGAAKEKIPAVVDGCIAGLSAYLATLLCPDVRGCLVPSHGSTEPGSRLLLEALGMEAPLHFQMHLGEGTGAALLLPLLDQALFLYRNLPSFGKSGIEAYKVLP